VTQAAPQTFPYVISQAICAPISLAVGERLIVIESIDQREFIG
jgi:hypothetical protein